MKITAHKLEGVPFKPAHSSGGAMVPTLIVLHDTAGRLEKGSSVDWFASKDCNTSAHVVVELDGSITQMVAFNKKAFHAGASIWKGREFCNGFSIGIEIVNPGALDAKGKAWFGQRFDGAEHRATKQHGDHHWLDYTPEQIEAVTALCRALADKYEIEDIVAHWTISPGRKVDTNPLFPLDQLREAVFQREVVAVSSAPESSSTPATEVTVESPRTKPDAQQQSSKNVLDWIIEQGSRIGKVVELARKWFWGTTLATGAVGGSATVAKQAGVKNGTLDAVSSVASDHHDLILYVVIVLLVVALAAFIFLARRYLVTAVRDGRYTPKGAAKPAV
jgi:N-acetylmuramoyl-L-alanine amidase